MYYFYMKNITILLIFLLFSCSKPKKEVVFWHAMGGPLGKTLDSIIQTFEKTKKISISHISMANYGALSQKLMGAAQSGHLPDIAQMYGSWAIQLKDKNLLLPIDTLITIDTTDFFPVFLKEGLFNGKRYTLPFNKSLPVIFYNKEIFKEYGIDSLPKTWQELKTIAKKLTIDKNNDGTPEIYGLGLSSDPWIFEILLLQNGGFILDEKTKTIGFNKQPGIDAANYFREMIQERIAYLGSGYQHQDDFLSGRIAMIIGTVVSWSFMKDKMTFEVGIMPFPQGKKKAMIIAGTDVGIFKNNDTKRASKAMEFLNYLLSYDIQLKWTMNTYYLPVRKSILKDSLMKKRFTKQPGLKVIYEQLYFSTFEPKLKIWFSGRKRLAEALEKIYTGAEPAEKALNEAAKLIKKEWQ